jgi:hypothetical protein
MEGAPRPLVVTAYYATYGDLPYRFSPLGKAFWVRKEPISDLSSNLPSDLAPLDVQLSAGSPAVRLLGYRLERPPVVRPGDEIAIELYWQPMVPLERPISFFVHLVGTEGVPLGQADRRHDDAPEYTPGGVYVDRYEFPVFTTAMPGTYQLIAGAYHTGEDGSWHRLTLEDGGEAALLAPVTIEAGTLPAVTLHATDVRFEGGLTLNGVDYDDTMPGGRRVYLHWRAGREPAAIDLYAGGAYVGRSWIPQAADGGYLTVAIDAPPAARDLGIDVLTEGGTPLRRLGAWGIPRRSGARLPLPDATNHYLPFGGRLALTGVQADDAWRAGEQGRVTLRWLGLRPVVEDLVVSVSVSGEGFPTINSDGVPALGAIPTFKWVRGSRVWDVHQLDLPARASGRVEVAVGVYDAFTLAPLPPMDERIARLGRPRVPLQEIDVE